MSLLARVFHHVSNINILVRHEPDEAAVPAVYPRLFSAQVLPSDSERCKSVGSFQLQNLGGFVGEIHFETNRGNRYCIVKTDSGAWACLNARQQSAHYLTSRDLSEKKLQISKGANLAGYGTAEVTKIWIAHGGSAKLRSDFLERVSVRNEASKTIPVRRIDSKVLTDR